MQLLNMYGLVKDSFSGRFLINWILKVLNAHDCSKIFLLRKSCIKIVSNLLIHLSKNWIRLFFIPEMYIFLKIKPYVQIMKYLLRFFFFQNLYSDNFLFHFIVKVETDRQQQTPLCVVRLMNYTFQIALETMMHAS